MVLAGIIDRQIKTYLAGKSDAELLAMVETLVLPRLSVDQMVLLRDFLGSKIAEASGPLTIGVSNDLVAAGPAISFPRFGDRS